MFDPIQLTSIYKPDMSEEVKKGMLTVAISLVKNEGDIIETWISHISELFDMVYIVDHSSMDGTREFLAEVAKARGNIHLMSFEDPGYFQAEITNCLAEMAAQDCPNAWIFPLDADEFLSIQGKAEFLALVKSLQTDRALQLYWKNCIPMSLETDEQFAALSPCLVPPHRGAFRKLAVHSAAYRNKGYRFTQGNHEMQDGSGKLMDQDFILDFAEIYHVPIRSLDHFAFKCIQGNLAYDALPQERKDSNQGSHWKNMVVKVVQEGTLDLNVIRKFIANYGQPYLENNIDLTIYGFIDSGWICNPLDIAYSPLTRFPRHHTFFTMTRRILEKYNNQELENFQEIVSKGNTTAEIEKFRERLNCADSQKFAHLAPISTSVSAEELETISEIELIDQFTSQAFTYHESPVISTWEFSYPLLILPVEFY